MYLFFNNYLPADAALSYICKNFANKTVLHKLFVFVEITLSNKEHRAIL